jgi:multidrug efflux pump
VLSLTLTPMMCALLLRPVRPAPRAGEADAMGAMGRGYAASLAWVLRHPRLTLASVVVTLVATGGLAWTMPKGFFPAQDTGLIIGVTEAPPDTAFARMAVWQQGLARCVAGDPAVEGVASFIGVDGTNPRPNVGRLAITLVPRGQRADNAQAVMARLTAACRAAQEMGLTLRAVGDLQTDSQAGRSPYRLTLQNADPNHLAGDGARLMAILRQSPSLLEVSSEQEHLASVRQLTIDRDSAARLGVSMQSIDDLLYDSFGQRIVATIFTQLNQYRVILEVDPRYQDEAALLGQTFVTSSGGQAVSLAALVTSSQGKMPAHIAHQKQYPAMNVDFDLAPGIALGDGMAAVRAAVEAAALLPSTRARVAGVAEAFEAALPDAAWLVVASLVVVYLVLGMLYESTIHPLTILSTLPSAGVGALVALALCGMEFTIIALIGLILLIGIVKKNAIMMIDFALQAERERGMSAKEAIYAACLMRFRPIMMTSLAALLGGVPLALGTGVGSELRRPLGVVICGGLMVSQLLTLYTTPVIYIYMDRLAKGLSSLAGRRTEGPVTLPSASPEPPR